MWDRIIPVSPEYICAFGWIERGDKRHYKDLALIDIKVVDFEWKVVGCFTSSAKHSAKIAEIFNLDHVDCIKLETFLKKLI